MTKGTPTNLPPTLGALTNDQVRTDMRRPISVAGDTIAFINILLWVIAAGIIAAVLYMSALERVGDFAVLKATGSSNRFVVSGLAIQAIILAIAAALVAVVLALLLVPGFPITVEIPARAVRGPVRRFARGRRARQYRGAAPRAHGRPRAGVRNLRWTKARSRPITRSS